MNQIARTTKWWYAVSFPWLATDETIVSATATVETEDPAAADVLAPLFPVVQVTIDNLSTPRRVLFLAGGDGIEGNIYHAKIAVLTSNQQAKTECYSFVIIGDC